MSEEKSSSDAKFRILTDLKTSTGKEYQDAMLGRVEYFKQKNLEKSQFNSAFQNTLVNALGTILDVKVKVDKALGKDNLNKVQDVIENILMFGL